MKRGVFGQTIVYQQKMWMDLGYSEHYIQIRTSPFAICMVLSQNWGWSMDQFMAITDWDHHHKTKTLYFRFYYLGTTPNGSKCMQSWYMEVSSMEPCFDDGKRVLLFFRACATVVHNKKSYELPLNMFLSKHASSWKYSMSTGGVM